MSRDTRVSREWTFRVHMLFFLSVFVWNLRNVGVFWINTSFPNVKYLLVTNAIYLGLIPVNAKTDVPNVDSAHPTANYQPLTIVHIQGREADIRVMSELNRVLDKKDIDGAQKYERQHIGKQKWRMLYKRFQTFQEAYTMVLVQLKEANGQVCSVLHNLR
ncbi:hypothetical protein V6N13_079537 [Hibiscus sabdariffa]